MPETPIVFQTKLINIDNSQGIRLPKTIIDQLGFSDALEIEVQPGQLIVRPYVKVRVGWAEAMQTLADNNDDILDPDILLTQWEETEWE